MNCGDIFNFFENGTVQSVLIGVVTGFISSVIVTKIYRWKDKKIEASKYLAQLARILEKARYFELVESVPISDAHVKYMSEFFEENPLPIKYSWIKLNEKETEEVGASIKLLTDIRMDVAQCCMMIGMLSKEEESKEKKFELQMKVDNLKGEITQKSLNITYHHVMILDFLKKYIGK